MEGKGYLNWNGRILYTEYTQVNSVLYRIFFLCVLNTELNIRVVEKNTCFIYWLIKRPMTNSFFRKYINEQLRRTFLKYTYVSHWQKHT